MSQPSSMPSASPSLELPWPPHPVHEDAQEILTCFGAHFAKITTTPLPGTLLGADIKIDETDDTENGFILNAAILVQAENKERQLILSKRAIARTLKVLEATCRQKLGSLVVWDYANQPAAPVDDLLPADCLPPLQEGEVESVGIYTYDPFTDPELEKLYRSICDGTYQ